VPASRSRDCWRSCVSGVAGFWILFRILAAPLAAPAFQPAPSLPLNVCEYRLSNPPVLAADRPNPSGALTLPLLPCGKIPDVPRPDSTWEQTALAAAIAYSILVVPWTHDRSPPPPQLC
jgi:hypothetical protein